MGMCVCVLLLIRVNYFTHSFKFLTMLLSLLLSFGKNVCISCYASIHPVGADLHTAQLMPLPLTVSCFSKIQIGFTFLIPADPVTTHV